MSGYWIYDGDCDEKFTDFNEIFDYVNDHEYTFDNYVDNNFDDALENSYDYWDLVNALRENKTFDDIYDEIYDKLQDDFYNEYYCTEGDIEFYDGEHFIWVNDDDPDYDERDSLLEPYLRPGQEDRDCRYFQNVPLDLIRTLVEKDYMSKEDQYNSSPTVQEFLDAMSSCPTLRAHGYLMTREREDTRITIEGLQGACTPEVAERFKDADNYAYKDGELYCWYD